MPNHVTNKLTVRKGTIKVLPALYSKTIESNSIDEKLYEILTNFSFEKIVKGQTTPISEWRWDNWGTRTDAYVIDNLDEWANDDETVNLVASFGQFETAWSPPLLVIRQLQKMFPDYTFALDYIDEQFCFCGCLDIVGEDNYSEEEKDLRYYGSYLLNYSHRELDEVMEGWENDVDKFIEKNS
jgi:hypothetical protein